MGIKQEQLQLTGGGKKENRRELDYYPTPKEVTIALMDFLYKHCSDFISNRSLIWEPACGNGAMSEVIKSYGNPVYSSDINTSYGDVFDFMSEEYERKFPEAIITNPPFNLSVEFIKKSAERAPIVCMLLKSQYWHARSRLDLFNVQPPSYVLPLTWRPDFLEHTRKAGDKIGPTMEVAWSVWLSGANAGTFYIPLRKPGELIF